MTKQQDEYIYDAVVLGGGAGGLVTALALQAAGASVCLLDKRPAPDAAVHDAAVHDAVIHDAVIHDAMAQTGGDLRTTALAPSSCAMLQALGVLDFLARPPVPVCHIHIADTHPDAGFLPTRMDFLPAADMSFAASSAASSAESSDVPASPAAYIVHNADLLAALENCLAACTSRLTILRPVLAKKLAANAQAAQLLLADGRVITTDLLIACDGRDSWVRRQLGIDLIRHDYDSAAVTALVSHALPHENRAWQLFTPTGPLALLPLAPMAKGDHCSALIWSLPSVQAKALCGVSDKIFLGELNRQLDGLVGTVHDCTPRASYPLHLHLAQEFARDHVALAGEAAHLIHPLAGQGYNLTLRDAAELAETFYLARQRGLMPGSATSLAAYARNRQHDSLALAALTHGLEGIFSRTALRPLRRAAMATMAGLTQQAQHAQQAQHTRQVQHTRRAQPRLMELADFGLAAFMQSAGAIKPMAGGLSGLADNAPGHLPRLLNGRTFVPLH